MTALKTPWDVRTKLDVRPIHTRFVVLDPEKKFCIKCKLVKPIEQFRASPGRHFDDRFPYCKSCIQKASKTWHSRNRDATPDARDRRMYGLEPGGRQALWEQQEGRCACCRNPISVRGKQSHIDHDHETGEVRGLLCGGCNVGLGAFGDSVERLEMAIAYLKERR